MTTAAAPLRYSRSRLSVGMAGLCALALLAASATSAQEAKQRATPVNPPVSENLKKHGGAWLLLRALPNDGQKLTRDALALVPSVIEKRLNASGNRDVSVAPRDDGRFYVEVPNLTEAETARCKQILEKPGRLEFRLLGDEGIRIVSKDDTSGKPGMVKLRYLDAWKGDAASPEKNTKKEEYLWVRDKAELSGKIVKHALPDLQPGSADFYLSVELHDKFEDTVRQLTAAKLGKPLAIVVDGEILSVPIIRGEFGCNFQISGNFIEESARELAAQLETSLDHRLTVEQSGTVPSPAPR